MSFSILTTRLWLHSFLFLVLIFTVPYANAAVPKNTLVLYDSSTDFGWMGEVYALQTANLVSHFGERTTLPIIHYKERMLESFDAVIYLGSIYGESIPSAFIKDVRKTKKPVMWVGENIWQLDAVENMAVNYGFRPTRYNDQEIKHVLYKETALSRSIKNGKIINVAVRANSDAKVLAKAVLSTGRTIPWSIQSKNFIYVTELPFNYVIEGDRYLVFCDLLFELLDSKRPTRHRAIVRLEDISPISSPPKLKSIADMLHKLKVPFTMATVPFYIDPKGGPGNTHFERKMHEAPAVVDALQYMLKKDGHIIVHGYTHQYEDVPNPYRGNSVGDYEFFMSRIDENNVVHLTGPVPKDSTEWATERGQLAIDEFARAGLKTTDVFEYPHYAGSGVSSRALSKLFPRANHRGMYFPGSLHGKNENTSKPLEQYFPYAVRDVFNWVKIPENMGHFVPDQYHGREARGVEQMLKNARALMVVRDNVSSFFYHKVYGEQNLKTLVNEMKKMGYTFISSEDVEDPLMKPFKVSE
ncbi:MAG: DUF2334 domain-containing protein [Moraxellaceae bacterium]|nr:DUF2334 domain-containing protein [Moraxellaceae bacterium]